jgi:hypothetical protein
MDGEKKRQHSDITQGSSKTSASDFNYTRHLAQLHDRARTPTAEEEKMLNSFEFEEAGASSDEDKPSPKRPRLTKGDTASPTQQDSPSSSHEQPRQEAGPSSSHEQPTAGHDRLLQAIRDELEASIRQGEARIRYDEAMKAVRSKLETLIQQEDAGKHSNNWGLNNYTGRIGTLEEVQRIRKYHILPETENSSGDTTFNLLSLYKLALTRQYETNNKPDKKNNGGNFVEAWDTLVEFHPDELRNILTRKILE